MRQQVDAGGVQTKVGDVRRRATVTTATFRRGVTVQALSVSRARRSFVERQVTVDTVARSRHLVLDPVDE